VQVTTAAEQLFFVTVRLQATGPTGSWIGTGFVYSVATDGGDAMFLVTNRHVFAGAAALQVSMIGTHPDGSVALGKAVEGGWANLNDKVWAGHPDPNVDVAVLPFLPMLTTVLARGEHPFYRAVPETYSLTAARAAEFDALENVVFVGYPSGIYDTVNLLPVFRRGMTATPIVIPYRGLPAFLVDAAVFPGSSGSPVFLFDRGMYATRGGATAIGQRLVLLGVLAAVHTRSVEGRVRELPTAIGVEFDQPVGLGIVFRAEAIDAAIEPLLERASLKRTAGQPAAEPAPEPTAAEEALGRDATSSEMK
jgi:hypothetical protein